MSYNLEDINVKIADDSVMDESNYASYTAMNGDNPKDNICRDYLRNVCSRGKSCKFRHPEGDEAKALGKKDLIFCHDFQNKECRRVNCKFVHCTKQEEEYYRSSGYLPEHIVESVSQKGFPAIPTIPVCKDYLKGGCIRNSRCKFRHVSPGQFQVENNGSSTVAVNNNNNNTPATVSVAAPRRGPFETYERQFDGFGVYEPQPKRQAYESTATLVSYGVGNTTPINDPHQVLPQHYHMLQEENARLLHKVEELKKQVVDLTATNQFLRDQNEQLRSMASKEWYLSSYQNSYLPQ